MFFFFFQAEDGIRDYKVTGVQTCALPICLQLRDLQGHDMARGGGRGVAARHLQGQHPHGADAFVADRKSTRLNSSHLVISYAVFCLKKKIERQLGSAGTSMPTNSATTFLP